MSHRKTQDEKYQMMTAAPIPGLIGRLAVPTIISMMITSFYNMADTFSRGPHQHQCHRCPLASYFPSWRSFRHWAFFAATVPATPFPENLALRTHRPQKSLLPRGFFLAFALGLLLMALGLLFLEPLSHLLGSTETILPPTPKTILALSFWARPI